MNDIFISYYVRFYINKKDYRNVKLLDSDGNRNDRDSIIGITIYDNNEKELRSVQRPYNSNSDVINGFNKYMNEFNKYMNDLIDTKQDFIYEIKIINVFITKIIFDTDSQKITLLDDNRNLLSTFDSNKQLEYNIDLDLYKNIVNIYSSRTNLAKSPTNSKYYLKFYLSINNKCYLPNITYYDKNNNIIKPNNLTFDIFDNNNKYIVDINKYNNKDLLYFLPNPVYLYVKLTNDTKIYKIKTEIRDNTDCNLPVKIEVIHNRFNNIIHTIDLPYTNNLYDMKTLYFKLLFFDNLYLIIFCIVSILLLVCIIFTYYKLTKKSNTYNYI